MDLWHRGGRDNELGHSAPAPLNPGSLFGRIVAAIPQAHQQQAIKRTSKRLDTNSFGLSDRSGEGASARDSSSPPAHLYDPFAG
jgi:hypothetical protein